MKYMLHDVDKELWAWVKQRACLSGLTINKYILSILAELKLEQELDHADKHKYDIPPHKPFIP